MRRTEQHRPVVRSTDPREETQGWLTNPPSVRYHRVRTSVAEQAAGRAPVILEEAKRHHRDGMSCWTRAAYLYDANGYKRWCIDCRAELGEQAYHSDGADVPDWGIGLFIALLGLIVLVVVFLGTAWTGAFDSGPLPASTPTTYGPPPTVVP